MLVGEFIESIRVKDRERAELVKERAAIFATRLEDVVRLGQAATTQEIANATRVFNDEKAKRLQDMNGMIDSLLGEIIEGRARINKRNLELGISEKLTRVKHLSVELSDCEKMAGQGRYRSDPDASRIFGVRDRINKMAVEKRAIESEIRKINYSNEIY